MQIRHYLVSAEYSVEIFGRILCRNSFRSVSRANTDVLYNISQPFKIFLSSLWSLTSKGKSPNPGAVTTRESAFSSRASCLLSCVERSKWVQSSAAVPARGGRQAGRQSASKAAKTLSLLTAFNAAIIIIRPLSFALFRSEHH